MRTTRASAYKKPSNPKDRAATDRLDLSLFPDTAVAYGALAFTEGDLKYGGYNWRKAGVKASVYIAALRRHVAKWWNGSNDDPHTRVMHLANALSCIAVMIDAEVGGMLVDDRPPKMDLEKFFESMKGNVKHLQELFPKGPDRFTEKVGPWNLKK